LVVVRLGDATWDADTLPPGTALPVYFDFLDFNGARWLTSAAPSTDAGSASPGVPNACTLTFGAVNPSSTNWWAETEGLPSIAAATQDAVVLPCHTAPAGANVAAILQSQKTIAILRRNGSVDTAIRFTGFNGMRGTATGLRQAATLDARSEFWIAGIASSNYGLRYINNAARTNTSRIHGSVFYAAEVPLRYQAGSMDLRSLVLHGSQLYVASSFLVEPNRNMAFSPYTPWGGIVRVADYGVLARAATTDANLLRGFSGRRNLWTFNFEGPRSLYVLEDTSKYVRLGASAQASAEEALIASGREPLLAAAMSAESSLLRPMFTRAYVQTAVANWKWTVYEWVEESAATKTYINDGCYSMVGRPETPRGAPATAAKQWAVYTTGRKALYRVNPAANTVTVVANAPAGQLYR
jgi:hypothetical protein